MAHPSPTHLAGIASVPRTDPRLSEAPFASVPFAIRVLLYPRLARPPHAKNAKGAYLMKRLLLGLFCAMLLGIPGPLPVASAQGWWWHHKGAGPAGAGAEHTTKKAKAHREKHTHEKHASQKREPLHKFPKTVGWWHKGPGPAGAGVK